MRQCRCTAALSFFPFCRASLHASRCAALDIGHFTTAFSIERCSLEIAKAASLFSSFAIFKLRFAWLHLKRPHAGSFFEHTMLGVLSFAPCPPGDSARVQARLRHDPIILPRMHIWLGHRAPSGIDHSSCCFLSLLTCVALLSLPYWPTPSCSVSPRSPATLHLLLLPS